MIYTWRVTITDSVNLTTGLLKAYTFAGLGTSLESKSIASGSLTTVPVVDIVAQENVRLRAGDITTSGFNVYADPVGDPPPYTDVQIIVYTYETAAAAAAASSSTDLTGKSFFWYVRAQGKDWYLGIVDQNGAPLAVADIDIEYTYQGTPAAIDSDDDEIGIPVESEHGFLMGVAYEYLRMINKLPKDARRCKDGRWLNSYQADFEDAIYDAIHRQIQETQQPLRIAPIDMRQDQQRIRTAQRSE